MAKKVLWLDDDPGTIDGWVQTLRDDGYKVEVVEQVSQAEAELSSNSYDLLILDVMISTANAVEESRYSPDQTALGNKTGLIFFLFNKGILANANMRLLVMTVRLDKEVMEEFVKSGLRPELYATKYDLRDANTFLDKIKSLMSGPALSV